MSLDSGQHINDQSAKELRDELSALRKENILLRSLVNDQKYVQSASLMQQMYEQASVGIVSADVEGKVVQINNSFAEMLGRDHSEIVGQTLQKFVLPPVFKKGSEAVQDFIAKKRTHFRFEHPWITKWGESHWTDVDMFPVFDAEGNLEMIFSIVQDIQKERLAQIQNRRYDMRIAGLIESSSSVFWECEADGRYTWMSRQCEEVFGLKASEVIGTLGEAFFEESTSRARPIMLRECLDKATGFENILVFAHNENREAMTLLSSGKPVLDENGEIMGFRGSMMDISKQTKLESALLESENRFQKIVESSNSCFWEMDATPQFTYISPNFEQLTGLKVKDFLHKSVIEVNRYFKHDVLQYLNRMKEIEGPIQNVQNVILGPEGKETYVISNGVPILDVDGEVIGFRGSTIDITPNKISEKKLRRALAELTIKNTELEQFAYITSHDLQEPIRHIHSYASMLEREIGESITEKGAQYLDFIQSSSVRMRQMVKELLAFSLLGHETVKLEETDLHELMDPVILSFSKEIREKNANVIVGDLPVINCDKLQFSRLFQNLLSNALKFTRNGVKPEISIQCTEHKWHNTIEFSDNGIGIPREMVDKIFVIFQRLHNTSKYEGHGIGLSVAKKIIEKHDGKMTVWSEPGEGTTFSIEIPKKVVAF
ncbi:MAG: PAS domain S-box protein [Flavobacteriales bacterium]|nr:PAS domain S-box protein [Flavobacteriales bacterium]